MSHLNKQNFMTLPFDNIDTDQIIPSEFLVTTTRSALKQGLFKDMRYLLNDTVIHQLNSSSIKILTSLKNFGCGSSREHAVWALKEAGFNFVIAESFADIFKSNAYKNQLLPIELPKSSIEVILNTNSHLTIDVKSQLVLQNNTRYQFEISSFQKELYINKQSEFDYLKSKIDYITSFEKRIHVK